MSSNLFDHLGLSFPPPDGCRHGCCSTGSPIEITNSYPFHPTADFILNEIWKDSAAPEPYNTWIFRALVESPEHKARIGPASIQSCVVSTTQRRHSNVVPAQNGFEIHLTSSFVSLHLCTTPQMVGTHLMRHSIGNWDSKMMVAISLVEVIKAMELFLDTSNDLQKYMHELNDLDCARDVVLFYEKRIPCSCLDQAKKLHTEKLGRCNNPSCLKYFQDKKLLTSSAKYESIVRSSVK
jgi:hypothetical protein